MTTFILENAVIDIRPGQVTIKSLKFAQKEMEIDSIPKYTTGNRNYDIIIIQSLASGTLHVNTLHLLLHPIQ